MSTTNANPFGFSQKTIDSFAEMGPILQVGGMVNSIFGSYYADEAKKYQLKSQALSLEHKQDMAEITARMQEKQAQQIYRAYNKQIQIKTLQAGAAKATAKTSFRARGIDINVGSTANVFASSDIMKEIDLLTMNSNKVRAANEMRLRGTQTEIAGTMLGVSANNMFRSAKTIDPFLNMTTTLLTGSGNMMRGYYQNASQAALYEQLANNSVASGSPTTVKLK